MRTNDPNAAHSGKLMVRMPRDLHDVLSRLAAEERVSLNQLVVALLSSGASWRHDQERGAATSGA